MKIKTVVLLIMVLFLIACSHQSTNTIDADSIQGMTIESIASDGISINQVEINDEDLKVIKQILSDKKQYEDNGFVFAEGNYRIIIDSLDKDIVLYPYCGELSTVRIGEEGNSYISIQGKDAEKLESIIAKYIDINKGIYEWSSIE